MKQIYVKDKTFQVESIPSETAQLVELVALCHNNSATFEMFSEAIAKDPGLSAKVLEMAHSPAYRQWNDSININQILIILGLRNVRQIVIASAIRQFFAGFSHDFNNQVQMIWFRALNCSNLTRKIGDFIGDEKTAEACLAGLLFQVGQLLLLQNYSQEYPALLSQYGTADNFCQLEQEALGVDHCELGAALLESWGLESVLIDAVRLQCAPPGELQEAPLLSKILAVASSLISVNGTCPARSGLARAGQMFNMTEDSILKCFNEALDQSRKMVEALGYDAEAFLAQTDDAQAGPSVRMRQAENDLAEQVKNIALTRGSLSTDDHDLKALLAALRISLGTLFSVSSLVFLQAEPQKQRLVLIDDLDLKFKQDICLSYQDRSSKLIKCFRDCQPEQITCDGAADVDLFLLRLLETELACALPVHDGAELTGVFLIGLTPENSDFSAKNLFFLELLIAEFARNHQHIIADQNQQPGMTLDEYRQIAHEVRNPLSIIKNYLYVLGSKIDQGHVAQEEISFINQEIERAGEILLRSKRPQSQLDESTSQTLNINEMIRSLDNILCNSLYKTGNIESCLQLDANIPLLQGAPDQLKQVLINLLKNAVEAMEGGGRMAISTRDHFHQNGREYVEITLKDSGPGLPEPILHQLFKPVVSTKRGHSGLGLSIVRNLVTELGGDIFCCSSPQAGTEFQILVPRVLKLEREE